MNSSKPDSNHQAVRFDSEKLIKVYVSAYNREDLQSFKFKTNIVCGTQKRLQYKIGKISIQDLKEQFESRSEEVFIAVFTE
jgi:homoserine dehydrogenase